jgi:putative acetyltransferase
VSKGRNQPERKSSSCWASPIITGRFGFDAGVAAPFASPYAGPYLQARLLDGLRPPCSGRADYAPAFAGLE